jgi:hypothetical protein
MKGIRQVKNFHVTNIGNIRIDLPGKMKEKVTQFLQVKPPVELAHKTLLQVL